MGFEEVVRALAEVRGRGRHRGEPAVEVSAPAGLGRLALIPVRPLVEPVAESSAPASVCGTMSA